jgi:uncharacterized protein (DUF2147 family)
MKHLFASAAIITFAMGLAHAAEPSLAGDWLVKEGYANIRIDNCGGKMWGIVAWEKKPGGIDSENPDPAKKTRPILGMPILIGLAPNRSEAGKWTGEIYNSQNGQNYTASISLADENTLNLEGCLWMFCQTQQWTRVKTPPAGAPPLPPIKGVTRQVSAKKGGAAPSDTCLRVSEEAAALERTNARK